jgi:cysteine desulfuration protein SufE
MYTEKFDHYVEFFQDIKSMQQLQEFLISHGKMLPENHTLRVSENYVYGCQSDIWINGSCENDIWRFQFDSNSQLIKGLGKMLIDCFDQCNSTQISKMSFFDFRQIAVKLSHQKQKSMQIIINKIQNIAIGKTI